MFVPHSALHAQEMLAGQAAFGTGETDAPGASGLSISTFQADFFAEGRQGRKLWRSGYELKARQARLARLELILESYPSSTPKLEWRACAFYRRYLLEVARARDSEFLDFSVRARVRQRIGYCGVLHTSSGEIRDLDLVSRHLTGNNLSQFRSAATMFSGCRQGSAPAPAARARNASMAIRHS
jgi:hypothetical protein